MGSDHPVTRIMARLEKIGAPHAMTCVKSWGRGPVAGGLSQMAVALRTYKDSIEKMRARTPIPGV
jgi:hypothetical protein